MPEATGRVTPLAVSQTSTLVSRTGSWKYIRPIYQDQLAPCIEACPVGIDIEGYLNLLREGRVEEACDLLLRENPMPAVTGRVCHHPCETSCNRCQLDEGVAVHAIERALGDLILATTPRPASRTSCASVGVVGSGPAGLACAYHVARLGYHVTVLEAASEPGGMLRLGIPEYRLPRKVLDRQIGWIKAQGVTIECASPVGEDVPWWSVLSGFDAVFISTGAHQSKALGVPGERLAGVDPGLAFLRRTNAGERPKVGKRVVVVGGGNTAMDCARTALRLGAEVTVLYRRTRAEMPAIADEVDEAEREGVQFVFLAAPIRLVSANGRVTAIGETADVDGLPPEIERHGGSVLTDPYGSTTRAAVFAGGDLANQPRTVADALGAGKRAAIGIDQYLRMITGRPLEGPPTAELRYGKKGNLSITRWRRDDPVSRAA